jgi:hypothetical protein
LGKKEEETWGDKVEIFGGGTVRNFGRKGGGFQIQIWGWFGRLGFEGEKSGVRGGFIEKEGYFWNKDFAR